MASLTKLHVQYIDDNTGEITELPYPRLTNDLKTGNNRKKKREQLERPVRGYFWSLEVSSNLHLHYHLCVAIDRLNVKQLPKELKFDLLWGQRTEVKFIKKSVRGICRCT